MKILNLDKQSIINGDMVSMQNILNMHNFPQNL
jgi:hypothetical protein